MILLALRVDSAYNIHDGEAFFNPGSKDFTLVFPPGAEYIIGK